jgi:hypothetical protein
MSEDGANFLMIEEVGSSRRLNPSPDDGWGLHLADVNLPYGELVGAVGSQEQAYLAAPPPDCLARRGRARGKRVGRLRLGRTRARLVAAARTRPVRRHGRILRWCAEGFAGGVAAAFSARNRAVMVVAGARGYRLGGVRVGGRLGRPASGLLRRRAHGFLVVRRGRVRAVGVATRPLLRKPRLLRRLVRRARVYR